MASGFDDFSGHDTYFSSDLHISSSELHFQKWLKCDVLTMPNTKDVLQIYLPGLVSLTCTKIVRQRGIVCLPRHFILAEQTTRIILSILSQIHSI